MFFFIRVRRSTLVQAMERICYIYMLAGIVLRANALQNGDLRLIDVAETTLGIVRYGNKSVRYTCRTQEEQPLQAGSRESCRAAQGTGHGVPHPVFYDNKGFSACTTPWTIVENGCYRVIPEASSWEDGRKECRRMYGDLARIVDMATNQGLSSLLTPGHWFLANDIRNEGQWEYDYNETTSFTRWQPGEPNNAGDREQCAIIGGPGYWYDGTCAIPLPFVCSRDTMKVRVHCDGTETRLDQCFLGQKDFMTCGASEMVKLSCSYTHEEEGFQAVSSYQGILQIYKNNHWRFLCDGQFGLNESRIACQQLNKLPHKVFRYSIDIGDMILKEYMAGCDTGLKFISDYTASGKGQFRAENTSVNVGCLEMEQCREGFYGDDCRSKCGQCAGGSCSVIDGSCPAGGCEAGYTGEGCTQECPRGQWGINCSNVCGHCLSNQCDLVHGFCISGRCQDGYMGIWCDEVMDTAVTTEVPVPAGALNEKQIGTTNTTLPQKSCSAQDTWIYPFAYVGWCLVLLTVGGLIFQFVYFRNKKAKAICPQEEQK